MQAQLEQQEFVLIPLPLYNKIVDFCSSVGSINNGSDEHGAEVKLPDIRLSQPSTEPVQFAPAKNDPVATPGDTVQGHQKEWLKEVSNVTDSTQNSKDNEDSYLSGARRKDRITGLIDLLSASNDITFNFSTKTFNIGRGKKPAFQPHSSIKIIKFLKDMQLYQKKIPDSYLLALDALFPASDPASFDRASKLILNRNSLSYIFSKNVSGKNMAAITH